MPRETVPADTPTVGAEVVADLDESNVGPLVTKEQNKQKKRIKNVKTIKQKNYQSSRQ